MKINDELFNLLERMEVWDVLKWAWFEKKHKSIIQLRSLLTHEVHNFIMDAEKETQQLVRNASKESPLPPVIQTKDLFSYNVPESISNLTKALKAELEGKLRRNNITFGLSLILGVPLIYLAYLSFSVGSISTEDIFMELKKDLLGFTAMVRRFISFGVFILSAYIGLKSYNYFHLLFFGDQSKYQVSSRKNFSFRCFVIGFTIFLVTFILLVTILSRPVF